MLCDAARVLYSEHTSSSIDREGAGEQVDVLASVTVETFWLWIQSMISTRAPLGALRGKLYFPPIMTHLLLI